MRSTSAQKPGRFDFPPGETFCGIHVQHSLLAGAIGELNGEGRAALERDAVAGWAPWAANGGLMYEQQILTASARTSVREFCTDAAYQRIVFLSSRGSRLGSCASTRYSLPLAQIRSAVQCAPAR